MSPKVTLIGLGNILMRDEGVGIHVANHMMQNFRVCDDLQIVDGGTSGLDLLPFIENREHVLFVDAVNFNKEPGHIGRLANEQVPSLFGVKDSLHHMGLMDLLAAAQLMEKLPKQICLVGIQPKRIETGLELTDTIAARMPWLIDRVVTQINSWGISIQPISPDRHHRPTG